MTIDELNKAEWRDCDDSKDMVEAVRGGIGKYSEAAEVVVWSLPGTGFCLLSLLGDFYGARLLYGENVSEYCSTEKWAGEGDVVVKWRGTLPP